MRTTTLLNHPADRGASWPKPPLRETDHDKIEALAQEVCDAVDEQLLHTGKAQAAHSFRTALQ
jgi:hypothetical protein